MKLECRLTTFGLIQLNTVKIPKYRRLTRRLLNALHVNLRAPNRIILHAHRETSCCCKFLTHFSAACLCVMFRSHAMHTSNGVTKKPCHRLWPACDACSSSIRQTLSHVVSFASKRLPYAHWFIEIREYGRRIREVATTFVGNVCSGCCNAIGSLTQRAV